MGSRNRSRPGIPFRSVGNAGGAGAANAYFTNDAETNAYYVDNAYLNPYQTNGGSIEPQSIMTAAVGDSITAQGTFTAGLLSQSGSSYIFDYGSASNYRMVLPPLNNKAVPGRTASQVATNVVSDLAGLVFEYCWLLAGRNSVTDGSTAASIQGSLTTVINHVCDVLGKKILLQTLMPPDDADDATQRQVIFDVNDWIRTQNGTHSGKVIVLDTYSAISDGSNNWVPGSTSDNVHPSVFGACILGRRIDQILAGTLGRLSVPDFSANNMLLNGVMAGTGGTVENGVTGQSSTNWRVQGTVLNTAGRTSSKNGDGSLHLEQNISGSSAQGIKVFQDVSGGLSIGDKVYGLIQFQINSITGLDDAGFSITVTGTGVPGPSIAVASLASPSEFYYVGQGYFVLRTPSLEITGGTGLGITAAAEFAKSGSTAVSAFSLDIKGISIMKEIPKNATVPAAFSPSFWTVSNAATGGRLTVTITTMPDNGGYAITSIDYRVDGGAWVNSGLSGVGSFPINGLTNGVAYNVEIRANNAIGGGPASDVKVGTPTAASGFVPTDLANLRTWYDASDTASITSSGGLVTQINDKSGNALHATSSGTQRPTTGTRTLNSLNVLDFNGANLMNIASGFYPLPSGPYTMFIVGAVDANSGAQRFISATNGSSTRFNVGFTTTASLVTQSGTSSLTSTVTLDTNAHAFGIHRTGSTLQPFYNGVKQTSAAFAVNTTPVDFALGASPLAANFLDGYIAEVVVYNVALSDADCNMVGNYFATKWGTIWTGF